MDKLKSSSNCFTFSEKNKKKIYLKTTNHNADNTAEGPGIGNIFIFFLTHSFTNNAPGSEIEGVPALILMK